jgi:hypothetical protein
MALTLPNLPPIEDPVKEARIMAAFSNHPTLTPTQAYRAWLASELTKKVLAFEMDAIKEQAAAEVQQKRLELTDDYLGN